MANQPTTDLLPISQAAAGYSLADFITPLSAVGLRDLPAALQAPAIVRVEQSPLFLNTPPAKLDAAAEATRQLNALLSAAARSLPMQPGAAEPGSAEPLHAEEAAAGPHADAGAEVDHDYQPMDVGMVAAELHGAADGADAGAAGDEDVPAEGEEGDMGMAVWEEEHALMHGDSAADAGVDADEWAGLEHKPSVMGDELLPTPSGELDEQIKAKKLEEIRRKLRAKGLAMQASDWSVVGGHQDRLGKWWVNCCYKGTPYRSINAAVAAAAAEVNGVNMGTPAVGGGAGGAGGLSPLGSLGAGLPTAVPVVVHCAPPEPDVYAVLHNLHAAIQDRSAARFLLCADSSGQLAQPQAELIGVELGGKSGKATRNWTSIVRLAAPVQWHDRLFPAGTTLFKFFEGAIFQQQQQQQQQRAARQVAEAQEEDVASLSTTGSDAVLHPGDAEQQQHQLQQLQSDPQQPQEQAASGDGSGELLGLQLRSGQPDGEEGAPARKRPAPTVSMQALGKRRKSAPPIAAPPLPPHAAAPPHPPAVCSLQQVQQLLQMCGGSSAAGAAALLLQPPSAVAGLLPAPASAEQVPLTPEQQLLDSQLFSVMTEECRLAQDWVIGAMATLGLLLRRLGHATAFPELCDRLFGRVALGAEERAARLERFGLDYQVLYTAWLDRAANPQAVLAVLRERFGVSV